MVAVGNRFHHMSETAKWSRTYLKSQHLLWRDKEYLTPEQILVAEDLCMLSRNQIRIHLHKVFNPWWDETRGWLDA